MIDVVWIFDSFCAENFDERDVHKLPGRLLIDGIEDAMTNVSNPPKCKTDEN